MTNHAENKPLNDLMKSVTLERTPQGLRATFKPRFSYIPAAACFVACFAMVVVIALSSYEIASGQNNNFDLVLVDLLLLSFAVVLFFLGLSAIREKVVFEVLNSPGSNDPFRNIQLSPRLLCHSTGIRTTTTEYLCDEIERFRASSYNGEIEAIYKNQRTEVLANRILDTKAAEYIAQLLTTELISGPRQET